MARDNLTAEQLREQLHYDKDTGVFTRRVSNTNRVKVGDVAGCVDKINGYTLIGINSVRYRAARLAFLYMTGAWPLAQVDHINGVKTDDRWCNLRPVTPTENCRNQSRYSCNTSGVPGVLWRSDTNKWRATIGVNRRLVDLGCFYNFDDAVQARRAAELKYDFHENHGRKKT
jgi:hypothetical protein